MIISLGRSAESMVYTTAAVTPNADESIGAAKTRTDTTRPIMQARRPNSVSSPPQSIVPPAMAMPMRPMAYATGPVNEVAIACIGASHGRVPAAEPYACRLKASASTQRVLIFDSSDDESQLRTLFISDIPFSSELSSSNRLDFVPAFPVSVDEQHFADLAPGLQTGLFVYENHK